MVIDTGVFIEHLRVKDKLASTLYLLPDNTELFISSISVYELYMGATTAEKKGNIRALTKNIQTLDFSDNIAYKAAEIYHLLKKQNKLIEFRDIFIAATCIVNQLPLVTLNKKHFNRTKELTLV